MNLAPKELSIATLPFGVWYYHREISALTPVGVPSGDGAGAGLVRHGDHGHEDGQQGGGRILAAAHCMSGKEGGGPGREVRQSGAGAEHLAFISEKEQGAGLSPSLLRAGAQKRSFSVIYM